MAEPRIEIIAVRDPDGDTAITVFVDGRPTSAEVTTIDTSRGWVWKDWTEHRDTSLAAASPACRAALVAIFGNPPGGEYVTGRDVDWLDGVQPSA